MTRTLYTLLLRLAMPVALLRLWWRGRREPGYRRHIAERFGRYFEPRHERPLIWVHAVSVGEARASAGLVRALAAEHPGHEILVTCTTAAGRDTLKALHGESVVVAWLPYDLPGAVRRFLEHYRPTIALLMETELWPNLVAACADFGVPVMLANARLSEKSAQGYRRFASLARPAFATLSLVCAQSKADAARLRSLGARRVEIAGNLKFDSVVVEEKEAAGREWKRAVGRPVLLLASTRDGEERQLADALSARPAEVLVVVVPRHPGRFDEVATLAQARRSAGDRPVASTRVFLGDTMGEMDFYYAAADVAIMGGSFAPLGGQNLIEACAAGVPVVLGPSMFNFAEATRLAIEAGAAVQVADAGAAAREALALLTDLARRERMGKAGRALCAAHRGATRRHLDYCAELLGAPLRARAPG